MNTRRKSTLFLVEQLIVIAVFALCAVACISILTASYFMASDSKDTENALLAAQNCAELFKATGGNSELIAFYQDNMSSFSDSSDDTGFNITLSYDKQWQLTGSKADTMFILTLSGSVQQYADGSYLYDGEISVDKASGGNLLKMPVAAAKRSAALN